MLLIIMKIFSTPKERFEPAGDGLLCRAPAKINLYLQVLGRDEDGYHRIDSAVAKITLYDELYLSRRADGQVRLTCSGLDCGPVEENLVFRAARMLNLTGGVDIRLTKRIPVGAGLGGGSSDAASTLVGLNRLFDLGLSADEMMELASQLGSDVPLFLDGPCVRVRGRGEIIEPIQVRPFSVVLIFPPVNCSTAEVYFAYDARQEAGYSDATRSTRVVSRLVHQVDNWRGELFNDLAEPAMKQYPYLRKVFQQVRAISLLPVHITGSGSGMFIICRDDDEARQVVSTMGQGGDWQIYLARANPW